MIVNKQEIIRPEWINICNDKIRCNGHKSCVDCVESRIYAPVGNP